MSEPSGRAEGLFRAERSEVRRLGKDVRAFVEVLDPPLRLLVCGAGHDAIPLVRAASVLGWNVYRRRRPARVPPRKRFPEASGSSRSTPPPTPPRPRVDERTYVVVMSHHYLRDKEYVR